MNAAHLSRPKEIEDSRAHIYQIIKCELNEPKKNN